MTNLIPTIETGRRVVLRAEDVWKSYDEDAISVLRGVDFVGYEGETVSLCGPSGCGKSTLLHLLGGLDEPDRGRVSVNSMEINRHRSPLRLLRHEIGFVFQLHNLIPDLTLEENCLIPTVAAGITRQTAIARLRDLTERYRALFSVESSNSEALGRRAPADCTVPRPDEQASNSARR